MKTKPKHHDKICEYCGKAFASNLPQAAYHSNACRQAAYRARKRARLDPGEEGGQEKPGPVTSRKL